MSGYEDALNRAIEKLPEKGEETSRFDIPTPEIEPHGNSTIVKNFTSIAKKLRRKPDHMMKFLTGELAVPGEIDSNGRGVFQGKFRFRQINEKLQSYIEEFVLCNTCGKPDTNLVREDRMLLKKCEACGSKDGVKDIKGK